jgi:hypothetical protein
MSIEVKIEEEHPGVWVLHVNNHVIMMTPCSTLAENTARKLHAARGASYREAMRILCTDIGMCEDFAEHIWAMLRGMLIHDGSETKKDGTEVMH